MSKEFTANAPELEEKVQTNQVTSEAKDVESTKACDSSYFTKKGADNGTVLKTEKIAKLISGSAGNGASQGMMMGANGAPVTGDTSSDNLGRTNATPIGSNTRRTGRYDRKIEKIANKLNFTPSEQYERNYVESTPLAEAKDKVQGYNGNYRINTYRTQKSSGLTPAELTWDRSIDYVEKDKIYYTAGQQVGSKTDSALCAGLTKGDFLLKGVKVHIADDGKSIDGVKYVTENVTPTTNVSSNQLESDNISTEINKIELLRQEMETTSGDESKEGWSPLSSAIDNPNSVLMTYKELEAVTGDLIFNAVEKLKTSLAFQINRGPKDGQKLVGPAVEMCLGNNADYDQPAADTNLKQRVFTVEAYKAGAPSMFIEAQDSISKYNNKADFLLQPRSWSMQLQRALANYGVFRMHDKFAKVYKKKECYSTIDKEYDPTCPIYMTDKDMLVLPIDMNKFSYLPATHAESFFYEDETKKEAEAIVTAVNKATSTKGYDIIIDNFGRSEAIYKIEFSTDGNNPSMAVKSLANGDYIIYSNHTENGCSGGEATITKVNSVGQDTSVVKYITVAEDAKVAIAMAHLIDVAIDSADQVYPWSFTYTYHDVRNNYTSTMGLPFAEGIEKYFNAEESKFLKLGFANGDIIKFNGAFSTRYVSGLALLICDAVPYMQRVRYNVFDDIIDYTDNHGYPFKDLTLVKDACETAYQNFSYSDWNSPLTTGLMDAYESIGWIMPEFFWNAGVGDDDNHVIVAPWYMCEDQYVLDANGKLAFDCDQAVMCWPSTRAGIKHAGLVKIQDFDERDLRLALDRIIDITNAGSKTFYGKGAYKYGLSTDGQLATNVAQITAIDLLKMPRELGLSCDAPARLCTNLGNHGVSNVDITGETCFRIRTYFNAASTANKAILSADTANFNRAANFKQDFYTTYAVYKVNNYADYGVLVSNEQAYDDNGAILNKSEFAPFTGLDVKPTLLNDMRALYTRIQVLPFVISPFDAIGYDEAGKCASFDLYELAYVFGLCGFRASDYTEDIYNRHLKYEEEAMLHVSDMFYEDSIFSK